MRRVAIVALLVLSTGCVGARVMMPTPNVVLEAMAAGKPVVCCDCEGVGELLGAGAAGQVIPQAAAVRSDQLAAQLAATQPDPTGGTWTSLDTVTTVQNMTDSTFTDGTSHGDDVPAGTGNTRNIWFRLMTPKSSTDNDKIGRAHV